MPPARVKIQSNCGSFLPVVALGALAICAGLFHGSPLAVAFGIPVVLGPGLLFAMVWRSMQPLKVRRVLPRAAFENDEISVEIELENRSRFSLFFPEVFDRFAPEYHATRRVSFPGRVAPGETVTGRYRGKCLLPRGIYRLSSLTVVISDPFGWIQMRREFSVGGKLKIYPVIEPCGQPDLEGRSRATPRLSRQLRGRGVSLEFLGVREYRPGDGRRHIHWPLTARHGQPVVREFARPRSGGFEFLLDLHGDALLGTGKGSSLEHSIRLALSLADEALRAGARVGLHASGQREVHVPAGRGRAHGRHLLEATVSLRPDGRRALDELIEDRSRSFDAGATIIFPVSPYLHARPALLDRVRSLRRRGLRVIALVFDEKTFRAVRYEEIGPPKRSLEFQQKLRARGAETCLISCNVPFTQVLAGVH